MSAHSPLCEVDKYCEDCWRDPHCLDVYRKQLDAREERALEQVRAKRDEAVRLATRCFNDRRQLLKAILRALELMEDGADTQAKRVLQGAAQVAP